MVGTESLRVHLSCACTETPPCCACRTAAFDRVVLVQELFPLFSLSGEAAWFATPASGALLFQLLVAALSLVCPFVNVLLAQQLLHGRYASVPGSKHKCLNAQHVSSRCKV